MQWQVVFRSDNSQRTQIVNDILLEKGLHPIIINKKDSAYLFGVMEVQVNQDEVIPAIRIIENIQFE